MCADVFCFVAFGYSGGLGWFGWCRLSGGWACIKDPALFQFFAIWNDMSARVGGGGIFRGGFVLKISFPSGGVNLWGGSTWFFVCGGFFIVRD